jgi:hypothetical protein
MKNEQYPGFARARSLTSGIGRDRVQFTWYDRSWLSIKNTQTSTTNHTLHTYYTLIMIYLYYVLRLTDMTVYVL